MLEKTEEENLKEEEIVVVIIKNVWDMSIIRAIFGRFPITIVL